MADLYPFKDKVIVVTGASRGVGLSVSRILLARGAKVSMAATSEANLANAIAGIEKDIPDAKDRVMTCSVDVSNPEQVKNWIDQTVAKFGPLDGAVNNAAIAQHKAWPITELPLEDLRRIFDINVIGAFNCLKEEMRHMKEGGSVVNVGSVLSKYASPGISAYSASKHALVGLTNVAAFEGAERNIRVNIVCPGAIDTDMIREDMVMPDGTAWHMEESGVPALFPRYCKPEDIAGPIVFLLGDDSKSVTKQSWYVDGGWKESSFIPPTGR
ncbi:NAD(P)-binding protein [Xylariomycetidae sp. FL0641]|nr:NAD(P)-binding protein [Xylariomycetidae sp. FL0641]